MWGRSRTARAALVAVFTLAFMTAGVTAALAQEDELLSITAESNGCETVTIHYYVGFGDGTMTGSTTSVQLARNGERPSSKRQRCGLVPDRVHQRSTGSCQLVRVLVRIGGDGQYFDQGTVQVEPCPVTTTTTTTQPTDTPTTTTTIAQVETDLPDGAGPGFGLAAALAVIGVSLLGGAALVAARREN